VLEILKGRYFLNTELNLEPEKQTFMVHPYSMDNYKIIKEWWEIRGFPPARPEHLPPTGRVVSFKGKAICAGFLFKTDANAAVVGNLVSNPDVPKELRKPSIDFLIQLLTNIAKSEGFTMVCCSTNIDKLGERFEKLGFIKTDENVSMYGRLF
jgi:hypothetical protein